MSLIIHNSPPPPDLEVFNNEGSEVEFDKLFPSCPDLNERILNLCLSHLKNDSNIKNLSLTNKNWNRFVKNYIKQIKKQLEETKPEEDYFYVYRDGDFYIMSSDLSASDNPLSSDQATLTKLTLNDSSLTTDNGTPKEDFIPIDNSDFKVFLTISNSSPKNLGNFKTVDSNMGLLDNQDIFNLCLSFPKNSSNIKTIRQVSKYWNKFVETDLKQQKNKYAVKIFNEIFSQDHVLIKLKSDLIELTAEPEMSPTLFKEICAATRQDLVVLNRIHKELIQILYNSVYGWEQPALSQARVPSEKELITITTLDLSGCSRLTSLPDLVFKCKNLTSLNLATNHLQSLQKIEKLTKLTALYIDNNKLKNLPNEVCLLPNLKILHLSLNEIHSLPDELWKLTKLENLNLSRNHLRSISEKISSLTNLKDLNIYDNWIYKLPPIMKDMKINITGCRFPREKMFPEEKQPETCTIQ